MDKFPADSQWTEIETPVGKLVLVASDAGLHAVQWPRELDKKSYNSLRKNPNHPVLKMAVQQLKEYFSGRRKEFSLPLSPSGTQFQMKVWEALRGIPFGTTISYKEQARRIGCPQSARAVGTANSKNPIAIVVPCHRVIATSGALSGFGGGVRNKEFLIRHEQLNGPVSNR